MSNLNNERFADKSGNENEFLEVSYNDIRKTSIFMGARDHYETVYLAFTIGEAEEIRDHLTYLIENAKR